MNNIIIYASNYGATKDYANKLALELDANIINIKDVNPKYLDAYDLIVIGSGLYASGLNESKKILKILKMYKDSNKKFIIFTVGIADPENINTVKAINKLMVMAYPSEVCAEYKLFNLRGALNYKKLNMKHRAMMFMLKLMLKHKKEKTPEDEYILNTYGTQINFVNYETLNPIINYAKEIIETQ